ncbi:DUF3149 domain-containing protein [Aliikangiella sp. G2MR2-5]
MRLLQELFSTPEGIMSFGVIFFVFVIAIYIFKMVKQKINEGPQSR